MPLVQNIMKAILPAKWSEAMEAESRTWVLRCPCGHDTSVWDMGGIRYKARGNPWRWSKCAKCGQAISGRLNKIVPAGGRG